MRFQHADITGSPNASAYISTSPVYIFSPVYAHIASRMAGANCRCCVRMEQEESVVLARTGCCIARPIRTDERDDIHAVFRPISLSRGLRCRARFSLLLLHVYSRIFHHSCDFRDRARLNDTRIQRSF